MSTFEERKAKMMEKTKLRKANAEKVTENFSFKSNVEEAKMKVQLRYNAIQFNIFRKAYNQIRGKEIGFGLNKDEVEELRDYLNNMIDNWDELKKLDIE